MTFGEELELRRRHDARGRRGRAASRPASTSIGVNCGGGPHGLPRGARARSARAPSPAGDAARSIMPNAGLPQRIEGQFVYAAEPGVLRRDRRRGSSAPGAAIVGGCCGTTPEHIAAMRAALDALAATTGRAAPAPSARRRDRRPAIVDRRGRDRAEPPDAPTDAEPAADPARRPRWPRGRFVVSVEIDPPRSIRIDRTIEAARLLQDAGVDLVNVSDSAMARVRMGALAVAFGIQHDLDLECLVHFTTRDRNLMALESELLGAHALGVRNILALTGDPPRIGDYPTGTGVWDVDSIGLVEILARLNRGEDDAGSPDRPAGRLHDRLRARPDGRRPRRPSGTASSASSPPAPT